MAKKVHLGRDDRNRAGSGRRKRRLRDALIVEAVSYIAKWLLKKLKR